MARTIAQGGIPPAPMTAVQEWREHWGLVLAAFIGFSFHSLTTYSAGLFLEPLTAAFGWTRAQATAGLSIAAMVSIPLGPVIGAVVDRWGARVPAILGLALTAIAVSGFALANGSFGQWIALWSFYAVVATGIKSTVWTVAITGTFTAGRGLALGAVMCGAAAAQVVTPPLTRMLIDTQGWRAAYVWLGAGWGGIALIVVTLWFWDARARYARASRRIKDEGARPDLPGLALSAALMDRSFLMIAGSTLVTMFIGVAFIVHQVPLLTDLGIAREDAAYLASLSGVAGIFGKLGTGWMSDRWDARRVGAITLLAPAGALALLLLPDRSATVIIVAMIVIGYASGAKLQISAYLISRFVGMRNFGKVFGIVGGLIAAGTGFGPVTAAWIFDRYGSYTPFVILGIPASVLCGLLIHCLPPLPSWDVPPTLKRQ